MYVFNLLRNVDIDVVCASNYDMLSTRFDLLLKYLYMKEQNIHGLDQV